jgi:hypothetical protein
MVARLWAIVAAVLLAAFLTAFTGGPASAREPADDPCYTNSSAMCPTNAGGDSVLLPVNRWADSTGALHSRIDTSGLKVLTSLPSMIQRSGTYPVLFSAGNSMWQAATGMTETALKFDVVDSFGEYVDKAAASLARSLMSAGILMLLAVVALGTSAWRAARGGGSPLKTIGKVALTAGLFATMIAGATQSDTVNGEFKPGKMSPGWWVVTTNNVVSSLASAPAAALAIDTNAGAGYAYTSGSGGNLSCQQYVDTLKKQYATAYPVQRMQNSVPLVMSSMWEATGLKVWSVTQFGPDNPYGDFAYCRLLEQFSGTHPAIQRSITLAGLGVEPQTDYTRSNPLSLAWQTAEGEQEDRTMVAWAQCRVDRSGNWSTAPGWDRVTDHEERSPDKAAADCKNWWTQNAAFSTADGEKFADGQSAFDWEDAGEIRADSGDPRVANYLLTLQGHTGGMTSSLALAYSYLGSSLIVMIVFLILSIAIIVAKVAMVVMMVGVFLALLLSLWPGRSNNGSIGKYFGALVGLSVFVFGIQLVLAFVTLVTSILVQAGTKTLGSSSASSATAMVWVGLAPAIALWMVHQMFTEMLRLPSPFTLSGASRWAAAASGGAFGDAVGADVMQRWEDRGVVAARRAAVRSRRQAINAVPSRVMPSRTHAELRAKSQGRPRALVPRSATSAGSRTQADEPMGERPMRTGALGGSKAARRTIGSGGRRGLMQGAVAQPPDAQHIRAHGARERSEAVSRFGPR